MVNMLDKITKQQAAFTERLIDTMGQDISLTRPPVLVPDGAGSFVPSTAQPIQLPLVKRYLTGLTLVGRGVNQQPERWIVTNIGKRYKEIFILIGMPDDDIQAQDYWYDSTGDRLEVTFVFENRSYQTKASVLLLEN